MKKNNMILVLAVLAVSSVVWASTSFASWQAASSFNVEGLTLDEAAQKYGVDSGSSHPVIFEVNTQSGQKDCGLVIATGSSQACPTAKIFYQSNKLTPNYDGTSTMKVDIYYDVNEVTYE
ncbi:MAG: hypothetical protein D3908_08270 [Candidatus Electrothrix sp. AUS4]|nr:hypothetical protein [Candidatus Electrothrix sp. AUS4]